MRKLMAILMAALLLLAVGCGKKENEEGKPSEAQSQLEQEEPEVEEERWERRTYTLPQPLTQVDVDDSGVDYAVVEVEMEPLFSLTREDTVGAQYYIVGGRLVEYKQLESVRLLDLTGKQAALLDCRDQGAWFSNNHFAMGNYETGEVTVYNVDGGEVGSFQSDATIQSLAVSPDGKRAAYVCDQRDGTGYEPWMVNLETGESVRVELSGLPPGVSLTYMMDGFAGDDLVVFSGGHTNSMGEMEELRILYGPDSQEVQLVAEVPVIHRADGSYIRTGVLTSQTGVVYSVADLGGLLGYPMEYGDEMYALYMDTYRGGAMSWFSPFGEQGRIGFFPLYNFQEMGMLDTDTALVMALDSGVYQVYRLTLGDRFTEPAEGGVDLSQESLDAISGQELRHRGPWGEHAHGLISAIVTQYTDLFEDEGYVITSGTNRLADKLYQYVIFNSYGRDRLEAVLSTYLTAYNTYAIPYADIDMLVKESFDLPEMEIDMRTSQFYTSASDTFDYSLMGGGIGETSLVYLESASHNNGLLDITVMILPATSSAVDQGLAMDKGRRLRMQVGYDAQTGRWCYKSVELLSE